MAAKATSSKATSSKTTSTKAASAKTAATKTVPAKPTKAKTSQPAIAKAAVAKTSAAPKATKAPAKAKVKAVTTPARAKSKPVAAGAIKNENGAAVETEIEVYYVALDPLPAQIHSAVPVSAGQVAEFVTFAEAKERAIDQLIELIEEAEYRLHLLRRASSREEYPH